MSKASESDKAGHLNIKREGGKSDSRILTEAAMRPMIRNGYIVGSMGGKHFNGKQPDFTETVEIMAEACANVRANSLDDQKDILTSQAMALDSIFTLLVARSEANVEKHLDASERFMRMALKAQSQCRTTIETLDKMVRDGTQTVKHVHVDNRGGQAVIADTVQTGGHNEKTDKQSHAKCDEGSPMLGHDPQGNGVPIASSKGQEAVQDARRD
ncbi:hypothetical protein [Parasphingorhabdus sp.]|uniref:hypothetical protein n=1 Tax=Parasphingorhabdus sp. TaxID=2709688 RepID=UPI003A8FBD56